MPRASVILNCFNHAAYVRQAIDSVLAQTCRDIELIAIDNGSTDESRSVLREYEGDPRVRLLLHDENRSISQRLNEGVDAARGEFVAVLYSDDWYLPERIERQLAAFDGLDETWGVVYGPTYSVDEISGERWINPSLTASGWVFEELIAPRSGKERREVDMCNPLVRRECLLRHRWYEDVFGEGEAIFFRIALTHRFSHLAEPLTVLRNHRGNAGKALMRNCAGWRTCVERLRAHPDLTPEQRPLLDAYEASVLRMYGWWAARVGADGKWARRCFADAVRLSPRMGAHPKTVAGVALCLLPGRARNAVNRAGHGLGRSRGNQVYVAEYEGL